MATLSHSESRRLYSWWWDSHISPKNSKWLQENLTDMDAKVKSMIKLIEEDADSFARRAEMYYKKRPELMKLVEEFYRAYRALAERYNHATGELRQAHRTMAQAFPDQVPFAFADDAASSSEPGSPEARHPIHSFFDPDSSQGTKRNGAFSEESNTVISRKGLKQLNDMFQSAEVGDEGGQNLQEGEVREKTSEGNLSQLSKENHKLKSQILSESGRASKAESELLTLRQALSDLEAERDAISLQYQQTLDKLSNLEKDLNHAQKDSRGLDELACEAKTDVQALKETLRNLEAERDTSLEQYRQSLERVAAVEGFLSQAREDSEGLIKRTSQAEFESQNAKQELARLEAEKEAAEHLYKQCLEKVAGLERELSLAEEKLKMLNEQLQKAESEVKALKEEINKLNEERDAVALRYKQSLDTISRLQQELSEAQAHNIQLNSEILLGSAELKDAEEKCVLLGKMNKSLQLEAKNLAQKIDAADQEISQKQAELEKLTVSLQDEHSRFVQVEATLHTLQNLHSQSQEEQRALALELRDGIQMMKNLEVCKQDLEVEIQQLKYENQSLNDLNSSSSISQKNLQDEMLSLKEIKGKLEAEVRHQAEQSEALQLQIHNLKEEIDSLYKRYQALMEQVESVDLDPECFASSVKALQDENVMLKEVSMKDREVLLQKLQKMEELLTKNASLESSLLEVNAELQRSKENAEAIQESCHDLNEEKSALVAEKASLLSQLQIVTETMQSLLEKNTLLQNSLCDVKSELEGLRAKSKGLEQFCELLSSERSNLLAERSSLVSRLEIVEQKLGKLEMRFTNLEEKYSGLENEKQSTLSRVEELRVSLDIEKQERACLVLTSEARLSGLEGRIHDLREENKNRKKEFEEQLDKAVNAQVEIFILQKFIQDMEDKNYNLLIECQRHIEAAKYSEKLISELESDNMIQQVESEFLLNKIDTLRTGINQVMKALEIKHYSETDQEQNFVQYILANIRTIEHSLSESKDENQRLLFDKSIVTTILQQLQLEYAELSSRKTALEQESLTLTQQLVMLENEKHQLLERSRQLNVEMGERKEREEALKAEVQDLHVKQTQVQDAYVILQEENLNAFEQNRFLQEELLHIKKENGMLEEENSAILVEALAFNYQFLILKSYGIEKALKLDVISKEMNSVVIAYRDLENEARRSEEKLLANEMENLTLKASMEKLEEKQQELHAHNEQLRHEISDKKKLLNQKEQELSEVEMKLKDTEHVNTELCSIIQCLEKGHGDLEVTRIVLEEKIAELSENNKYQEKAIIDLRQANGNLESEVGKLHEEIEEYKIREVILASELHERSGEFEMWEAEAASFYFDLQISSVREVLLENKVHELGIVCEDLEDVSNRRSVEIERMKGRITSLESEAESLKSQLTTCVPLIASLKNNVALLEKSPVLLPKLHAASTTEQQENFDEAEESLTSFHDLSEVQKLQDRIKAIEDILEKEKEKAALHEHSNTNVRLEAALKEIEDLRSRINANNQEERRCSAQESVSESSDVKVGAEMKDIPLDQASGCSFHGMSQRGSAASSDQMLELWEAAEQDCSHDQFISEVQEQGTDTIEDEIIDQTGLNPTPESHFEKELGVDTLEVSRKGTQSTKEGNKKNVLERLASDAQKLISLQVSVQELKGKMEPNRRRKKAEDVEYGTLKRQIQEMENSMVQLMDMNAELMRTIEESSMTSNVRVEGVSNEAESIWQKRVSEQAQKEAEKIGRLELEMQRMQYVLLRLKEEKKSKGRDGISRSSAAVLLRDFFYSRGRKRKKHKTRFCGCLRPAAANN